MFCDGCDLAMTVDERVRTTPDGADLCDVCWDDALRSELVDNSTP